jgi:hypothetical protein
MAVANESSPLDYCSAIEGGEGTEQASQHLL